MVSATVRIPKEQEQEQEETEESNIPYYREFILQPEHQQYPLLHCCPYERWCVKGVPLCQYKLLLSLQDVTTIK